MPQTSPKSHALKLVGITLLVFLLNACNPSSNTNDPKQENVDEGNVKLPNIVLIITDDQGWGDVSFNGNTVLQTPNIDGIGHKGVSFERFYVNPVCSSTRAALLTGRHYLRTGVFSVTRGREKMHTEEITIAEMLKEKGYKTGLFGKWHNGAQFPHDPNGQGFDEAVGIVDGHQTLYFDAMLTANGKPYQSKGYIADVTTDAAIDFIERSHSTPFFAYVPFNTPHSPFEVPNKYFDKFKQKGVSDLDASVYGMMENIDDNVGRILTKLEQLKLDENTIVLYMSDNGPSFPNNTPRYNGGLKGRKGHVDEGGVRSPLFIHWPSKISGGKSIKSIAQHLDIAPTIMSLVGGSIPAEQNIDGTDISSLLLNQVQDKDWPNRSIFTHHFRNTKRESEQAVLPYPGAVRTQNWLATFQRNEKWYLYDMNNDEQQKFDVSKENSALLETLKSQYFSFYEDVSSTELINIPTELGHTDYDVVTIPAHESFIEGEDITYAHGYGWSHDWLSVKPNVKHAKIKWPIKAVKPGTYSLAIQYANKSNTTMLTGNLNIFGQTYPLNVNLEHYIPTTNEGAQRYPATEAHDLNWKLQTIGEYKLSPDNGNITIEITDIDNKTGTEDIMIKAIVFNKIK